jgi:hypothetical protein
MTATLRVASSKEGGFCLRTRLWKRLRYALAAGLLVAALAVGLDLRGDFSPERAPGSVLYLALLAGATVASLADRVVAVEREPRALVVSHRILGRVYRTVRHEIPDGTPIRLRKEKRNLFVLEVTTQDTPIVLDASSWKTELDPMGRRAAEALGLPYEG